MRPSEHIRRLTDSRTVKPFVTDPRTDAIIAYLDEREELVHPIARAHPAPTSSPGEDIQPEVTGIGDAGLLEAERRKWEPVGGCYHPLILPTGECAKCGVSKRDDAREELERVRAENARLVEELAKAKRGLRETEADWYERVDALTESERLVSELRAELAKRDVVLDAARYIVRLKHHPMGEQHDENAMASLMLRLDELDSALEQPQAESIEELIARSSLGTPEALAVRAQADPAVVARVLARADELSAQAEPGREIVVGSKWAFEGDADSIDTVVAIETETRIRFRLGDGNELCPTEKRFREQHTHVSDPPTADPRPIVVGSKWRHINTGHNRTVTAYCYGKTVQWVDGSGFSDLWDSALFLAQHEWLSDPPVSERDG